MEIIAFFITTMMALYTGFIGAKVLRQAVDLERNPFANIAIPVPLFSPRKITKGRLDRVGGQCVWVEDPDGDMLLLEI